VGDVAIHDEEAFPEERFAERVGGGAPGAFQLAGIGSGSANAPPTSGSATGAEIRS